MDENTGETLPYADILIKGTTSGTNTNLDGYFTLFKVPSDTTLLEISYVGYQTSLVRLTPETDISNLKITLNAAGTQLAEILVSDVKKYICSSKIEYDANQINLWNQRNNWRKSGR